MEKRKELKKWIPEIYLIASVLFYWISTANLLNLVAISLLVALSILFVWKIDLLGIIIAALFLMLSMFMVLALISELSEFSVFNSEAVLMFFVGGIWLGLNIWLSVMMILKWGRKIPVYENS